MTRKLISLVLALCMIMSCFAISGISASAATAPDTAAADETITVYFSDSLNWGNANVYYWGTSSDPEWPGTAMTVKETNDYGEKVYQATIPAAATGIIFNGNGNKTVDITTNILNGSQWYTLNEKDGDGYKVGYVEGSGSAAQTETTAPAGEDTTTAPVQSKYMYVSPGAMGNPTQYAVYTWNDNEDGEFVYVQRFQYFGGLKDNAIIVTSNKSSHDLTWDDVTAQTVDFKVESGRYVEAISEKEGNKFKVRIYDGAATTTTAPVVADETTAPVADDTTAPATVDAITVYFTDGLGWGSANVYAWDKDEKALAGEWPGTAMTVAEEDNGFGQKVYKAIIPETAEGIVFNNGTSQTVDITEAIADGTQWYPTGEYENNKAKVAAVAVPADETTAPVVADETTAPVVADDTTAPAGDTVSFKFTDALNWGNIHLYAWDKDNKALTAAWPGDAGVKGEANDYGQMVYTINVPEGAAGVIVNGDGGQTDNITNFAPAGGGYYVDSSKTAYNEFGATVYTPIPWGTTTDETTAPVVADDTTAPVSGATYVLFGWINGANYSCDENASQASEYVFENGSLTATFAQDSYIAVKTADNANWYMTNGYPGDDKTSATLYNTSVTGENSNKLKVPGGVQVTITLTDNGDGSFTLAYTTGQTVETTKPSEDEDPTVPGSTIMVYFTDANGWGAANVYAWDDGDNELVGAWPGKAMTVKEINDYGQTVYQAEIPSTAAGIVFNGNGAQTVDITEGIAYNAQWYTTGEYTEGKANVQLVEAPIDETTAPVEETTAPVEETTAPVSGDTITVYFTDGLGWGSVNVYYWNDGPEWPGTAMTVAEEDNGFGQKVYKAEIPANAEGIIFNGNGTQTVDITSGIVDGAQWYPTGEYEDGNAKVEYIAPAEPTTAEPEEPTTVEPEEPTTVEPEEPTTVEPEEPTTVPAADDVVDRDGVLVVADDFTLQLNTAGKTTVTGEIYLAAGEYKFRMQKDRVLMGYNTTINDVTTKGLTYNAKFKAQTTLVAQGGVYKFQFSTTANALIVSKADSAVPAARLTGDLHTILKPVPGNETVVVGSMYVAPGEYNFKVMNGDSECGYNKVINDTTGSGMLSVNPKYKADMTLNATGGMYTFKLFTKTNKFSVAYVNDSAESKTDVHVAGDINLVLSDNDGANEVATGSVTLGAGTYSFKIYNYGVVYTIGGTIRDTATKNLKSSYTTPVTLNATGGTYTFTFNKTTGQLNVAKG